MCLRPVTSVTNTTGGEAPLSRTGELSPTPVRTRTAQGLELSIGVPMKTPVNL